MQNYTAQYKRYILQEKRVSRKNISPHNIYRLSTYKKVSGNVDRNSGSDRSLIFVTGKFEGKVYGLKISYLQPTTFFDWSTDIVTNEEVINENNDIIHFADLTDVRDERGEYTYNKFIKNNSKLMKPKIPFRSYSEDGIQYVSEVFLKKNILELNYG